jgi:transposase
VDWRLSINGFWLLLKRLEQDLFIWPSVDAVPTLTVEQLHWLLDGIDIAVVQRQLFAAKSEARGTDQKDLFLNEAEALAPTDETPAALANDED